MTELWENLLHKPTHIRHMGDGVAIIAECDVGCDEYPPINTNHSDSNLLQTLRDYLAWRHFVGYRGPVVLHVKDPDEWRIPHARYAELLTEALGDG